MSMVCPICSGRDPECSWEPDETELFAPVKIVSKEELKKEYPMKVVYKYPIKFGDEFTVAMPRGAKFRKYGMQMDRHFMWCEVEAATQQRDYILRIFATGQDIPLDFCWLGTVQDGPYVWHLYSKGAVL